MNYGKKGAGRRKRELASRGAAIKRKFFSGTLLAVLLLLLAGIGYVGYFGYNYVKEIIMDAPDVSEIDATPSGYMSTVLDEEENVTAQLAKQADEGGFAACCKRREQMKMSVLGGRSMMCI